MEYLFVFAVAFLIGFAAGMLSLNQVEDTEPEGVLSTRRRKKKDDYSSFPPGGRLAKFHNDDPYCEDWRAMVKSDLPAHPILGPTREMTVSNNKIYRGAMPNDPSLQESGETDKHD